MQTEIGPCTVELTDDGTLDTVLVVWLRLQPQYRQEVRFDHETVADRRDPKTGELPDDVFQELAAEAYEEFRVEMEYLKEQRT